VHCVSKKQVEYIRWKLEKRFQECGLLMHPEKTKIVYCRSERFGGEKHENKKFDFLGYTFQTRWIKGRNGIFIKGFSPAVSKEASRSIRSKIKQIIKQNTTASIEHLASLINPIVRGWLNYFRVFFKSRADKEVNYIKFV
jgi:RNA-directed DNA polymerase